SFFCTAHHPDLHSFPTRRSSDLARTLRPKLVAAMREQLRLLGLSSTRDSLKRVIDDALVVCPSCFRIRATYLNFARPRWGGSYGDRKSTRLNSSHVAISYAVFCL